MPSELTAGCRVLHPKKLEWGIGQVVGRNGPNLEVYFEHAGDKKLRIDLVSLQQVEGDDAQSPKLDAKFKPKSPRKQRAFKGDEYFNDGDNASRKKFVESLGATCNNWYNSWSFINEAEHKIFFGAWKDLMKDGRALIFSNDWKSRRGRKQAPWPESRENIRRIEEDGYTLHVFTMILDPNTSDDFEGGTRGIGAILNDITEGKLVREGDDWWAVFE